jgi:hypothetical protein
MVVYIRTNLHRYRGRGNDGELGHGERDHVAIPTKIKAIEEHIVTNVACGNVHSLVRISIYLSIYPYLSL